MTGSGPGPEDSAPTIPFGPVLGLLVVVAVGARVAYTLTIGQHLKLGLDATGYILLAAGLASGHGYANPAFVFSGFNKATANFVPGYPLFLAGLLKLGITTRTGFQLAGALCGGLTVLLTGFFARRISGRASVGLVAAGLVAASPVLIASDGSVMSETIAVPLTVGLLLAVAWAGESTSLLRWGAVGLIAGLLVLVRSEDLLTALLLVPAAALVAPTARPGRRALQTVVAVMVVGAVLAPWVVRNYETFSPHVFLSSNDGKTLAGANCPTTYHGDLIGYWDYSCIGHDALANSDEGEYDKLTRAEGTAYLRSHAGRVPLVVGARVLRAWGLFDPWQQARLDVLQTRSIGWQQLAWPPSVLVLVAAIPGIVRLRKDRLALVLVAGPVVIATVVVATTFGNPRYVVAATPSLCVGVAVTALAIADRVGRRRHRVEPESGSGPPRSSQVGTTDQLQAPSPELEPG